MSCSQYSTNEDGTTKEVSVFILHLKYRKPRLYEKVAEDFKATFDKSQFAKEGWKLVGDPAFVILGPELYESYSDFIDDGIIVAEDGPKPANTVSHLRLVKKPT